MALSRCRCRRWAPILLRQNFLADQSYPRPRHESCVRDSLSDRLLHLIPSHFLRPNAAPSAIHFSLRNSPALTKAAIDASVSLSPCLRMQLSSPRVSSPHWLQNLRNVPAAEVEKKKPRQTGGTGRGFWVPMGGNLRDGARDQHHHSYEHLACVPLNVA